MKALLKYNINALLFLVSVWFLASYVLLGYTKGSTVLFLNDLRTPFLDHFFLFVTKLGEPTLIILISVVVTLFNWKKGVLLGLALIVNTIIVQVLKKVAFAEHMRPLHYLKDQLNLIEGLDVHSSFSFPSGHTTGGFTLFFMLALFIKNKFGKLFFIACGVLVAISRVYLSQHFLEDVFAASLLASVSCICYYLLYNKSKLKFE